MFGSKTAAIHEAAKNLPETFRRQFFWTPEQEQEGVCEYIKHKLRHIEEKPFYIYLFGSEDTAQPELSKKLCNIVVEHFKSSEACSVSAPNEAFAADVNGALVCPTFLLKPDGNLLCGEINNEIEKQLRNQLSDVKTIIFYKFDLINPIFLKQIDKRLRVIFGKEQPFGGLSVIAFGDITGHSILTSEILEVFEVIRLSNLHPDEEEDDATKSEKYQMGLFKAKSFNKKLPEVIAYEHLKKNKREAPAIQVVALSHRYDKVEAVNKMELDELNTERKVYNSKRVARPSSGSKKSSHQLEEVHNINKIVDSLEICVGSTVITTCDLDEVKNGELGKVTSTSNPDGSITVDFFCAKDVKVKTKLWTDDKLETVWEQFPLRPAAALTVANAKGLKFDGVVVMPDEINDSKGINALLGKAKSLDHCTITPYTTELF